MEKLESNTCSNCFKVFTGKTLKHFNAHIEKCGITSLRCEICSNKFTSLTTLKNHLKRFHTECVCFPCKECGKQFKTKYSLKSHEAVHTKGKTRGRFPCDYCDKTFAWKPSLRRHLQDHVSDDVKAYICQCGKSFHKYSLLYSHKNVCQAGDESSAAQDSKEECGTSLTNERTQNSVIEGHSCQFCGEKFMDRQALSDHIDNECDPFSNVNKKSEQMLQHYQIKRKNERKTKVVKSKEKPAGNIHDTGDSMKANDKSSSSRKPTAQGMNKVKKQVVEKEQIDSKKNSSPPAAPEIVDHCVPDKGKVSGITTENTRENPVQLGRSKRIRKPKQFVDCETEFNASWTKSVFEAAKINKTPCILLVNSKVIVTPNSIKSNDKKANISTNSNNTLNTVPNMTGNNKNSTKATSNTSSKDIDKTGADKNIVDKLKGKLQSTDNTVQEMTGSNKALMKAASDSKDINKTGVDKSITGKEKLESTDEKHSEGDAHYNNKDLTDRKDNTPRIECKKVLSAYRHLEPSCTQPATHQSPIDESAVHSVNKENNIDRSIHKINSKEKVKNSVTKSSRKPTKALLNILYVCLTDSCCRAFYLRRDLEVHKKEKHNEKLELVCSDCKKSFGTHAILKSHLRMVHLHLNFVTLEYKNVELRKFKDEGRLILSLCTKCGQIVKPSVMDNHSCAISTALCFFCPYCTTTHSTYAAIQNHLKEKHPDKEQTSRPGHKYVNLRNKTLPQGFLDMTETTTQCDVCQTQFDSYSQLQGHISKQHATLPYICGVCSLCYGRKAAINRHMRLHNDSLICTVCNKAFYDKKVLMVHENTHTGLRPFACDLCDNRYYDNRSLKKHMQIHHVKEFLERYKDTQSLYHMDAESEGCMCPVCGQMCSSSKLLEKHILTHNQQQYLQCSECEKTFKTSSKLRYHMLMHKAGRSQVNKNEATSQIVSVNNATELRKTLLDLKQVDETHPSGRPYSCTVCHKRFKKVKTLNQHIHCMHLEDRVKNCVCHVCDRGFPRMPMLKAHMRVHTNSRPYRCRICHKTFKQVAHIRDHLRAHGKRLYTCRYCSQSFKTAGRLSSHVMSHCTIMPFTCPEPTCKQKFASISLLLHHNVSCLVEDKPGKQYFCYICNQNFQTSSDVILHLYKHENDGLFPCELCEIKLNSFKLLYFHKVNYNHFVEEEIEKNRGRLLNKNVIDPVKKVDEVDWDVSVENLLSQYDYIEEELTQPSKQLVVAQNFQEQSVGMVEETYGNEAEELILIAEQLTHMASGVDQYTEIHIPDSQSQTLQYTEETVSQDTVEVEPHVLVLKSNTSSQNLGYPAIVVKEEPLDGQTVAYMPVDESDHGNVDMYDEDDDDEEMIAAPDGTLQADPHGADIPIQYHVQKRGFVNIDTSCDNARVDSKKILNAYEIHRHLEPSCTQPTTSEIIPSTTELLEIEVPASVDIKEELNDLDVDQGFEGRKIEDLGDIATATNALSGSERLPSQSEITRETRDTQLEVEQDVGTELTNNNIVTKLEAISESAIVDSIDLDVNIEHVKIVDVHGNDIQVSVYAFNDEGEQEQVTDIQEVLKAVLHTGKYKIQCTYKQIETIDDGEANLINNADNGTDIVASNVRLTEVIVVAENEVKDPAVTNAKPVSQPKIKHTLESENGRQRNCKKIRGEFVVNDDTAKEENETTDKVNYKASLNYYEERDASTNPFVCQCGLRFSNMKKLNHHKKTHLSNKQRRYQCNVCEAGFNVPSLLKVHMRSHTGEKPFTCKTCGKAFRQLGHLQVHIRGHRQYTPFKCTLCPKQYRTNSLLTRHMKLHATDGVENKGFPCDHCSASFVSNLSLKLHQFSKHLSSVSQKDFIQKCNSVEHDGKDNHNSNNDNKPAQISRRNTYICDICGVLSTTGYGAKLHRQRHDEGTDFKCSKCEKGFSSEMLMKEHYRLAHTSNKCQCEICGELLKGSRGMRSHLLRKHNIGSSKYQCRHCQEKFATKSKFFLHVSVCMKNEVNQLLTGK